MKLLFLSLFLPLFVMNAFASYQGSFDEERLKVRYQQHPQQNVSLNISSEVNYQHPVLIPSHIHRGDFEPIPERPIEVRRSIFGIIRDLFS